MNKSKINFIIDIMLFICIVLIASIGFLIKYTLIPGKEAWKVYGKNVELLLFGLDRHQWGTIHLYIAFFFLFLLLLHICLHWKMITGLYKNLITSKTIQKRFAIGLLIFFVITIIFPFIVKPKVVEKGHYNIYKEPKKLRLKNRAIQR